MPLVSELKTKLQAIVAPGDDTKFLRLLQEADDRLLEFGRWNWTRAKLVITPDEDDLVALPEGYSAVLGARLGRAAINVHAEEFEFTPEGVGEIPIGGCYGALLVDQGMQTVGTGEDAYLGRVYKVTGQVDEDVTVLAKVASAVLVDDEDSTTRCPDVAALKLVMLAIIFEEENDIGRSNGYFATALRGLDNKERSYRGGAKQTFNFNPFGTGISRLRNLR